MDRLVDSCTPDIGLFFWASLAIVLVTWGLVPTQSGIFATKQVSRTFPITFDVSTSAVPVEQQPQALASRFAQSTYGTVVLNKTLPPYMTRNYTLAPFRPSFAHISQVDQGQEQWTTSTTLYSLDLRCEVAIWIDAGYYNSSKGCGSSVAPTGNVTIHNGSSILGSVKGFQAQYTGYYNLGWADFSLEGSSCPQDQNHTFFAVFTQNKQSDSDPPENVTAIFCTPDYYSQKVNATVDSVTKSPISVVSLEPKRGLDAKIFHTTWMEQQLNGGFAAAGTRGNSLPDTSIPNYMEKIADMDFSWTSDRQPMLGLAVLIGGHKELANYLDWETLAASYSKAYRLLFAHAITDALQQREFAEIEGRMGNRTTNTEAVVLEPVFTYIVVGFFDTLAVLAAVLLYLSVTAKAALHADPGTIASVMGLMANNQALLADFEGLDCCTNEEIREIVADKRYRLIEFAHVTTIVEVAPTTSFIASPKTNSLTVKHSKSLKAIQKPVRPKEFTSWMSILLIGVFLGLAIALAVLFAKSRSHGIALPSQNKFVQNLLENYVPTAIATLIEPIWVLINRLLCLLQPIEELQHCDAKAKDSIDIDYGSLPPQLVIGKALRARHFILVAVCTMALLANLLSIAFAGLFHHDTVNIRSSFDFEPPLDFKFISINGSIGPEVMSTSGSANSSGAYHGGNGRDQFLALESNHTRNTSLLAWTDKEFFYLPFFAPSEVNNSSDGQFEAETSAFGAKLDCRVITPGLDYSVNLYPPKVNGFQSGSVFNNILTGRNNVQSTCISSSQIQGNLGPAKNAVGDEICQRGPAAIELVMALDPANANASQYEKEVCWESVFLGWIRNANGSCGTLNGYEVSSQNSFFVQCSPRLLRGRATVRVDKDGYLMDSVRNLTLEQDYDPEKNQENFENSPINLIAQSNRYLFNTDNIYWHNDSYALDFMNHFIQLENNSSRLLDPKSNVPVLEEVQKPLNKAYASLFAAWLGANKEHLFVSRTDNEEGSLAGWKIEREERLFLSIPLFAIAEGMLCIYAIAACLVYIRRPGKYLAQLPTSIASVVPLFAGSTAVQDMRGISQTRRRERFTSLEQLDYRYGYGSYVGIDGRVHIGIERAPLVRPWKKINPA